MEINKKKIDEPGTSSREKNLLSSNEEKILILTQSKSKGISDADISRELPNLDPSDKAKIINKLLIQDKISIFQQGNELLYRLKTQATKGADQEEKIVYSIIEEAGNKGIWIRDIRIKSNLMLTQLNKVLKSLETKKFIKAVKSVSATKKKAYMLYNLEPDRSVTGGSWYQDQDFESEFVDVLNQQCHRYLEHKKDSIKGIKISPIVSRNTTFATSNDVWKYISDLGISKIPLSIEDIEMILNTLVFDNKVEKIIGNDGITLYRSIQSLVTSPGLITTPCGVCPIRKDCCEFGDITPAKCKYLTEWLNL